MSKVPSARSRLDAYVAQHRNVTVDQPMIGDCSEFIDPICDSIIRGSTGGLSDLIFISSQMGTQKTGLLTNVFKRADAALKKCISVLCITPRITLSYNMLTRFNADISPDNTDLSVVIANEMGEHSELDRAFYLYTDQKGLSHRSRIVISPESLKRLFQKAELGTIQMRRFDLIILDEFVSTILHSDSKTLNDRRPLFFSYLSAAIGDQRTTIVCMDAFMCPVIIEEHRLFRKRLRSDLDTLVLYNRHAPITEKGRVRWVFDPYQLKAMLHQLIVTSYQTEWIARSVDPSLPITMQIIMCFGSIDHMHATYEELLLTYGAWLKESDILCIDSGSGGDAKMTTKRPEDPLTGWGIYSVVMYTSSVQSGVNYYNKPYYDAIAELERLQARGADCVQIGRQRAKIESCKRTIHVFLCCSSRSAEAEIMVQMGARSREFATWTIYIQQCDRNSTLLEYLPVDKDGILNTFNSMGGVTHALIESGSIRMTSICTKILPGETLAEATKREKSEDYYHLAFEYGSLSSVWYYIRNMIRNQSENNYLLRCADILTLWNTAVLEFFESGNFHIQSEALKSPQAQQTINRNQKLLTEEAKMNADARRSRKINDALTVRIPEYKGKKISEAMEMLKPGDMMDSVGMATADILGMCVTMGIPQIPSLPHTRELFEDWMIDMSEVYKRWATSMRQFGLYNKVGHSNMLLQIRQSDIQPENILANFYYCTCFLLCHWCEIFPRPKNHVEGEFYPMRVPTTDRSSSHFRPIEFSTDAVFRNARDIFLHICRYRTSLSMVITKYGNGAQMPAFLSNPEDPFILYQMRGGIGPVPDITATHMKSLIPFLVRGIFPCAGVFLEGYSRHKRSPDGSMTKIRLKPKKTTTTTAGDIPGTKNRRSITIYAAEEITYDIAKAEECRAIRETVETRTVEDGPPVKATIEFAFGRPFIDTWKYAPLFFHEK